MVHHLNNSFGLDTTGNGAYWITVARRIGETYLFRLRPHIPSLGACS